MSHIENNRPYPVTAGYQKSASADRPGPGLCGARILLFGGRIFERSLVRCSGSAMVPRKVIEVEKGAGVWGGLAPIIEVRNSGPPGSGSLRRDGVGTCSDETKPNLPLPPQKLCPQNRGFSWTKVGFERFCPQNRPFSWTKSSQPESVI